MNNYKELVSRLRYAENLGDAPVGDKFVTIISKLTIKQAADAIEDLVRERDNYKDGFFGARYERDMAISDLQIARCCETCQNHQDDCESCQYIWRGAD